MTSQHQYYHRAIFVTIYFASTIIALQQLAGITDNVSIALADTNMLFDFEPPTAFTQTKHGVATTRELHTPVTLITFSMVDMAYRKTLRPLPSNNNNNTHEPQIRDKVAYLTQTSRVK